jgi:hypothetical protein
MEVHKPKPVHSWRELFKEIGIIVIGVIIALSAEQIADAIRWSNKVADAEAAIQRDLGTDMGYAAAQLANKDCTNHYLDRLEIAVRGRDPERLRRLAAMESPFSEFHATYPWRIDSWTAAISSGIPDHISRERLAAYAFAFRMVTTQRERQFALMEYYSDVVGGQAAQPQTPEVSRTEFAALNKLRANTNLLQRISEVFMSNTQQLGVAPDASAMANLQDYPARCQKQIEALGF